MSRVMQPARRAPTKEELKRLAREDLLSESEPESEPKPKPRPKSKQKSKRVPSPTSVPTAKQKTKPPTNSSSSRKRLSAIRKPPGYREEPSLSLEISEIDLDLHSGPSTSPSLAGTRSKRSLKVPARFSDPEFAFRDAVEPVKVKPPSPHGSRSSSSSSTSVRSISPFLTDSSTNTPTSTPAPSNPSKSAHISLVSQKSKTVSPSPKRPSRDEKRENEDAGDEPPSKILKRASHPSVTLKKQSVSLPNETAEAAAAASPTRPPLEQVADSVQASEPSVKSEPAPAESQNVRHGSPSKKKKRKPSSKSRARSPDKTSNTNSLNNIDFSSDSVGATISHSVNMTIQPAQQSHKPQLQQLLQQPLPQIQQIHQLPNPPPKQIHIPPYGSRLLPMDQPILLPVSVAPIGPITTNLAAVSSALRRPPFVSPMLEMSLKHDKTIRQRLALENLPSMLRIASHLGIKDRINLGLVNKMWKTFINSETIWTETIVTPEDLHLDAKSLIQHLTKSRTTELQFKVNPSEIPRGLIKAIVTQPTTLKRIYLSSTDRSQNTAVFNLLKVIDKHLRNSNVKAIPFRVEKQNLFIREGEIHWKPRVTVDGLGYLRVEMGSTSENVSKAEPQEETFIEEELDNLRVRFDWKKIYDCKHLVSLMVDCVKLC